MPDLAATIRERYLRVLDTVAAAARKGGRSDGDVRLVVVTKLQPVEIVQAALEAGARIFGENYAEEAAEKITVLGPQSGVEWHMIGHVQSRKAQLVVQHFDLVHSLDSLRLAQRLNRLAAESGRTLPVLLELNVSGEKQHLDLWQANRLQLEAAGVKQIEVAGICTACHLEDWFSHRAEKGKTGRFGVLIALGA